jgi:hypothetical protein
MILVALKLLATRSVERDPDKSNQDWLDIRKIIQLHALDPADPEFARIVQRFGGPEALERIRLMCNR